MRASQSLPPNTAPPRPQETYATPGDVTRKNRANRPNSWQALRHPLFLKYFVGSLISNLGTWLQNTAQMLLAYQLTHSAFTVGLITCAQFIGFLLFGSRAGVIANRLGRRRVLIVSQLLSAAVAAILAFLILCGTIREWELVIGALIGGAAFTFALPVQTAMISTLVSKKEIKGALAMNSVSYNGGRTLAPILCLVVLVSIGTGWAFALNAITFLIFAFVIISIKPPMTGQIEPTPPWSGLRFAIRRPRIMLLLAMVAAVTVAEDPVLVLGPSLAHQALRVPSVWAAYFLSALGLGTVIGSILPVRLSTARRSAIPLAVLALAIMVFALGINAYASLFAAAIAGAAGLLTGTSAQTLLLKQAGPGHATQVMGLWALAWAGTKPIASLADGWLVGYVGLHWTAVLLAGPALGVAVLEGSPGRYKRILKNYIRGYNYKHGYVAFGQQPKSSATAQAYSRDQRSFSVMRTDRFNAAGPASNTPDAFRSRMN
jgi:predicted MFS family arabinose efflux permease